MKFISSFMILFSLISCGKHGGISLEDKTRQDQQERKNHIYLETSSVAEADLLNVTINEPVNLSGDRIIFGGQIFKSDQGKRITCSISIGSGEIWHLQKTPSGAELSFPDGSRHSLKPVGTVRDLTGPWIWKGRINNMEVIRRYSFFSNRLILNQDCES